MTGPRRLFFAVIVCIACGGPGEEVSSDSEADAPGAPPAAAGVDGGGARAAESPVGPGVEVRVTPGLEILITDSLHLVRDRRVGLITNQTGVDREGGSGIDLLWEHPEVDLVALFSPEHGIRGDAPPGALVGAERDPRTGLPVHSLYGETRSPTPEMLENLDVLLFDLQDVGARYYTYVSTMALAMEAAGEAGLSFVVLDRPDPIDGIHVQGTVLEPEFSSFIGMFPVPMRHGMTPGELARLYRGEFGVEVDLAVVPAAGWRRGMRFDATGLPWVAPSPNLPTVRAALHYPGTCLFEGTGLSVGRGTDLPFEQVGAPWVDGEELARRLEARGLADVRFEAVRFTPTNPGDGKHDGVEVPGIRFVADGLDYDPILTAVTALVEARRMGGDAWEWLPAHFDLLAGTDALRLGIDAGLEPEELTAGWEAELRAFRELRGPYLVYEE